MLNTKLKFPVLTWWLENRFGPNLSGAGEKQGARVGIQIEGCVGGGDTACKSCLRLHVMKNHVLTLNLFLQQKLCFSMGLISFDTKKNKTLFCVLIVIKASEIDASGSNIKRPEPAISEALNTFKTRKKMSYLFCVLKNKTQKRCLTFFDCLNTF